MPTIMGRRGIPSQEETPLASFSLAPMLPRISRVVGQNRAGSHCSWTQAEEMGVVSPLGVAIGVIMHAWVGIDWPAVA